MVLIWSFHRTYQQPPSFYLKAPTLLYVFIFIALRALRFDARYVLLAGGTAIIGWAILMIYAAVFDNRRGRLASIWYLPSYASSPATGSGCRVGSSRSPWSPIWHC